MTRDLTDSDLLAVPGGAYAVLRRIRERVLSAPLTVVPSLVPTAATTDSGWPDLPPACDPWRRPPWDTDTVYLQLLVTTG